LDGDIWHQCGVTTEYGTLRQVLLASPGEELEFTEEPDHWLMHRRPNLARIQNQCKAVVDAFRRSGVQVRLARPKPGARPNRIFQRDLFFMTPEGAVVARPAALQRAGEERQAAESLARLGIPILMSFRGHETFEGADALWLDPKTVLIGVGLRTNEAAFDRLADLLEDFNVASIKVPMPTSGIQHLLGVVNFIDRDLVALRSGFVHPSLLDRLEELNFDAIDLPEHQEITNRGSMNFVTLGPRKLLMPAECPLTRARYEAAGVEVHEVGVSEYLAAAGGVGCLTGVLRRDTVDLEVLDKDPV
jgi:N-dimethylarginine dimethylaminohydrolase